MFGIDLLFHPAEGGLEKDIGAESFGGDDVVIVKDEVIEVLRFGISDKVTKLLLS